MKYSIIKYLLGLFLIFTGFVILRTDILYAQSGETTDTTKTTSLTDKAIEIFTSNTCEFCTELEEELKKTYDEKSYVLNNIDTSTEAKTNFQIALVACNKDQGTVPMFLHQGTCVSGKDQILEVFKTVNSANTLKAAAEADQTKVDIVTTALEDLTNTKVTDALRWYDYAIAIVLLLLFITGLFLVIRLRKSQNKKFKLFGALVFFIALSGLSAFLWIKVNDVNTLSSTGADAKKNSSNCIEDGNCKDWNEFVKAKAKKAEDEGNFGARKEWESRVVDQKVLDQQKQAEFNSLLEGIKTDPEKFCGVSDPNQCNYGKFLSKAWSDSGGNAESYKELIYGVKTRDETTGQLSLGDKGLFKQAVAAFNNQKLNEAYDKMLAQIRATNINSLTGQAKINYQAQVDSMCAVITASLSGQPCSANNLDYLLQIYKDSKDLLNKFFEVKEIDAYTGLSIIVPKSALYDPGKGTDECTVPTSGGACPIGTQTCDCQQTPVQRYACGPLSQTCNSICIQTHNVCDNCKGIKEIPPEKPGAPVCQQSCSANNPCGDGTSCINGKCENPSCVGESDCLCGTDEISCGDGLINNSDQAPEQCELGNPEGTSCSWDSCNQNTCKCPDSNPNWDIEKTSSLVCVNNNTANAYAEVKFNISATYINESSPTTVGVLDKVEDKPVNYLVDWLDPASISNGGTYTTSGNYVDKIIWDLTGALSQFTIPTGETQVTKTDFLSYTFNIPKEYFGRYVNLVTGTPEDGNVFSYTNSVYVACNVPSTALPANTLVKIVIGMFLIGTGLIFAYTQRGEGLALSLADSKVFTKISMLFISKEKRKELEKEQFENDVLKK